MPLRPAADTLLTGAGVAAGRFSTQVLCVPNGFTSSRVRRRRPLASRPHDLAPHHPFKRAAAPKGVLGGEVFVTKADTAHADAPVTAGGFVRRATERRRTSGVAERLIPHTRY